MNDDSRRNPYLILGVPFGSSASDATKAFAKRSRAVRAGASNYSVEDLTWALHQIEHAERNPHATLNHFRLPADPGALESLALLKPQLPATPIPRRKPKSELQVRRDAAKTLLRAALAGKAGTGPR